MLELPSEVHRIGFKMSGFSVAIASYRGTTPPAIEPCCGCSFFCQEVAHGQR
jgi:hypothetical protein